MSSASKKREETRRLTKLRSIEEEISLTGFLQIAGVDEVGRGALAGPVVAAACIVSNGTVVRGVNDSKALNFEQRRALYQQLIIHPEICYGIGVVEALEIDKINILQANWLAMKKAIAALPKRPDYLLVDGNALPQIDIPSSAIVGGDKRCFSIAAASVIAKVTRDHIMMGYHDLFPAYGFHEHMGYGTEKHLLAIKTYGPCPIHRKTFIKSKRVNFEEMVC